MLLACVSIAGCQSWQIGLHSETEADRHQGTTYGARVSMTSGDRVLTGIVVAVLLAEGMRYYLRGDGGMLAPLDYAPEADPRRTINPQDCTAPVDPRRGNLLCR